MKFVDLTGTDICTLLTSVYRVAMGTDLNSDIALMSRARLKRVFTVTAADRHCRVVFGTGRFHGVIHSLGWRRFNETEVGGRR